MTRRLFLSLIGALAALPVVASRLWSKNAQDLVLPQPVAPEWKDRWMGIGNNWYRIGADGVARFDHEAP